MTPDEKIELAELLKHRMRSEFDIRGERMRAAEKRLGMRENGEFTGRGLAELLARARRHDAAVREGKDNRDRFSEDEFAVLNCGFRNHQEIEDADCRRQGANLVRDDVDYATRRTPSAQTEKAKNP